MATNSMSDAGNDSPNLKGRISTISTKSSRNLDMSKLLGSLTPLSPTRPHVSVKSFPATYFGTVSVSDKVDAETIPRIVHTVMKGTTLDRMIEVSLEVSKGELRVIDSRTTKDIKIVTSESLSYTSISANDSRVLVLMTRMSDSRVPVLHGHVFAAESSVSLEMKDTIDTLVVESMVERDSESPDVSDYQLPPAEPIPQNELLVVDAYYLGYMRVLKKEGAKTVKKASDANAIARALILKEREKEGKPKIGLLRGGGLPTKGGIAVEDDEVTIIVTPKSFRIIDRLAGETLYKTMIANLTFATSTKGKTVDLFGCIVSNERLKITNCHLFHVNQRDTSRLGRGMAEAIQINQNKFSEAALLQKIPPWHAEADAVRTTAPKALYEKQIHRSDLRALAVIGAGEYGEVYLALQSKILQTSEGKTSLFRIPRAVKMMTISMKDDFLREALVMLRLGDHENIVRMVGVAVQQSPWLAVLEFMQYGDLRAVLKACKEDSITLEVGEHIHLLRQLAQGCAHISSCGVLHMDLAARNCLLGVGSVVKIGDFGMSRKMCDEGPYLVLRQKIPLALKWMSIEAMDARFFSEASDCWSFGVTMWEIWSYGEVPFSNISLDRIQVRVREGARLSQPKACPDDIWAVVEKCWKTEPVDRWNFVDLAAALADLFKVYTCEIRDIGVAVAGAAPPAWAVVDPTLETKIEDELKLLNSTTDRKNRRSSLATPTVITNLDGVDLHQHPDRVTSLGDIFTTTQTGSGVRTDSPPRRPSSGSQHHSPSMSPRRERSGSGGSKSSPRRPRRFSMDSPSWSRRSRSKADSAPDQNRDNLPITGLSGSSMPNFSAESGRTKARGGSLALSGHASPFFTPPNQ
eukprot:m.116682 g.116682  ORF g.116682 m.116682 type:complete len:861 (+) comp28529_c0_seq1:187-2769(+)